MRFKSTFVIFSIFLILSSCSCKEHPNLTVSEVEKQVTSGLKPGANKREVFKFLDSKKILHTSELKYLDMFSGK